MPGIKQELRPIDALTGLRHNCSTKQGAEEVDNASHKRVRDDRNDSEDEVEVINRYVDQQQAL